MSKGKSDHMQTLIKFLTSEVTIRGQRDSNGRLPALMIIAALILASKLLSPIKRTRLTFNMLRKVDVQRFGTMV